MDGDQAPDEGRRWWWIVAVGVVAVAAAAIGVIVATRSDPETVESEPSTTPAAATQPGTVPATVPATEPLTVPATVAPTVPPTEPPTVPATEPPAVRWLDEPSRDGFMVAPCCGDSWYEPESPTLPAEGEPLADGRYPAEVVQWSPGAPTRLVVAVHRFVSCAEGITDCTNYDEAGVFPPDASGISPESVPLELSLEPSVDVLLAGIDLDLPPDQRTPGVLRRGDGAGLATLFSEVAAAYDASIAAPITAGTPVEDVVADLQQTPRDGFSSAQDDGLGQLYFSPSGGAPAILFQSVADQGQPLPRSGTSAIMLGGVDVRDGRATLHLYAGFRP